MSLIPILELIVDGDDILHVLPEMAPTTDYSFIHRDASSVRWDEVSRTLYALSIKDFSIIDYYQQILRSVAREYGDHLVFTSETLWKGIPDDVISKIRNLPA